jgi:fructoselysine-6-P-deglycase FrlB-like protein
MRADIARTGVWQDTADVPEAVASTLDRRDGFADVAEVLASARVKRIVATGNGASFYVAHALWLAALQAPAPRDVVAIPAGLLADGSFAWRESDALLAVSSSGELRDLTELLGDGLDDRPVVAITARRGATIPASAHAAAVITVPQHRAVTHTGDFCAATAAILAIWAEISGDSALADAVRGLAEATSVAAEACALWADDVLPGIDVPATTVCFGSGAAWTAGLEAALMVKEIAGIAGEGLETREAATSALTATARGHLYLALPTRVDPLIDEACALAERRGAQAISAPGGALTDSRLSPVTTFPAAIALSVELGLRGGLDVDSPDWYPLYLETARSSGGL